jgi:structural maintenance of chromosome 1
MCNINIKLIWLKYLNITVDNENDTDEEIENRLFECFENMNFFFTKNLVNMIKKEDIKSLEEIFNIIEGSFKYKNVYKLFNLIDLASLEYKLCKLNNLKNIQSMLDYFPTDNETFADFNFDINIIHERMIKYSEGIINSSFPFKPYNYIIAGGFVLNCIIGTISNYTDIDIYIYNNFEKSVEDLVEYFEKYYEIKMTYNKSIINIYPVGYKINIQLINIIGLLPEQIISDFDMSYSQIVLFNWDNIQMTFPAYKTLITGDFTINKNAIVRNYRIIKGYVKGFKLDPNTINKIENDDEYQFNLLDEVKLLIKKILSTDNNTENIILSYLEKDSNEYKLMTKSIYLDKKLIEKLNENELIKYLELNSGSKYFVMEKDFDISYFEAIKYYINYDSYFEINDNIDDEIIKIDDNIIKIDDNIIKIDDNINDIKIDDNKKTIDYPLDNIEILDSFTKNSNKLYKLFVDSGNYYKNYIELKKFSINIKCKVSNLKLLDVSNDNILTFQISFGKNYNLKNLINCIDTKIEKIIKNKNINYNFNKILNTNNDINNDTNNFNIITSASILIKNLIYNKKNKKQIKNVMTYNYNLRKLKKEIYNGFKNTSTNYITLDMIDDCNMDYNQMIKLKIFIDGFYFNENKNQFEYNLKSIITK